MKHWGIAVALAGMILSGGILPDKARATASVTVTPLNIGQSFVIDWLDPASVTGASANLSATGIFTVDALSSSTLSLGVTIDNTTTTSFQSSILAMGIQSSQGASPSLSTSGSVFTQTDTPTKGIFPGGFKNIDACVYAANNCSGGNINNGLLSGKNDSFVLDLAFNPSLGSSPSITLSQFAIKFQTQAGSYEFGGTDSPLSPSPEPASLILFGSALLALLAFASRKDARLNPRQQ